MQLAKYLGAAKVIATGRNEDELEQVKALGADVTIPFTLGTLHPSRAKQYEEALIREFANGIDVVVDYLWGESARTIIAAIAKGVEDATPVRLFTSAAQAETKASTCRRGFTFFRNCADGKWVQERACVGTSWSNQSVFEATLPARLQIATKAVPLSEVDEHWSAPGKPRVVFTLG